MSEMTESQRLQLIAEAIRYCQRVREMGMPSTCYSKALREPVYFLWACRGEKRKEKVARYRSRGSVGLKFGTDKLRLDHAIPFKYQLEELLQLSELTPEAVREVLLRYDTLVLITKEENGQLNASGLGDTMPGSWDRRDPFARYKAVGIELVDNS